MAGRCSDNPEHAGLYVI